MDWKIKLLVASLFATSASFSPFFSLFMQDKGFDSIQIGSMISFSRLVMLVSTPAACAYADRRGTHRGLLAVLALVAGFVILLFPVAPQGDILVVGSIFLVYSMCSGSKLAICDTIVLHACKGKADRYPLQRLWGSIAWGIVALMIGFFLKYYHADRRAAGLPQTYELVPVLHAFFQGCFAAVLMSLIPPTSQSSEDAMTEQESEKNPSSSALPCEEGVLPSSRGYSRGTSPADINAEAHINRGVMSVDVTGPSSSITCTSTIRVTSSGRAKGGASTASALPAPSSVWTVLRGYAKLSQDRRIFFPVIFGVSLLSLSEVAMNNFLFPYLRRELKAPPELFSYLLAIHSVSEVVSFLTGSHLVSLVGPQKLLVVSSLAFCTKATWYAVLENPWSLLYVEMLHGVCFATMWTAAVAHVSKVAEGLSRQQLATEGEELMGVEGDGSRQESAEGKASVNVRAASMAMTTLWFFANGLPNILGGIFSGYVVQTAEDHEVALFQMVAGMAFAVAMLFSVYGTFGCFSERQ